MANRKEQDVLDFTTSERKFLTNTENPGGAFETPGLPRCASAVAARRECILYVVPRSRKELEA